MRDTAIEQACGHLGSAITQSIPADDQIIMAHVRAAYELLRLVRDSDRKIHDPSPAEAHAAELETTLEFIEDMEGQDGMTDALFAEKTLEIAHITLASASATIKESAS